MRLQAGRTCIKMVNSIWMQLTEKMRCWWMCHSNFQCSLLATYIRVVSDLAASFFSVSGFSTRNCIISTEWCTSHLLDIRYLEVLELYSYCIQIHTKLWFHRDPIHTKPRLSVGYSGFLPLIGRVLVHVDHKQLLGSHSYSAWVWNGPGHFPHVDQAWG